jgi:hypothetical protein
MTMSMCSAAKGASFGVAARHLSWLSLISVLAACSDAGSDGSSSPMSQSGGASGHVSSAGAAGEVASSGMGGSSGGEQTAGNGGAGGISPIYDDAGADAASVGLMMPIQRGNLYVLEFGNTNFTVDGMQGARITTFSIDGTNILTGPNVNAKFWGSTFWTAPESDWMPPNVVANIDTAPYAMSIGNDSSITAVGMTANVANKMVSVTKHFAADLATKSIAIEYTLTNKGTASFQLGHWEVTRVPPGGLTFYPAGTGMAAYGPIMLEKVGGYYWFDHTKFPAGQIAKAGGDDVGSWVAHVMPDPAGDIVLIKSFPDIPPGTAPPGHSEIEIFSAADKSYVEIEAHNRMLTFMPGQAIPWPVRWYLRRLPVGTMRAVGSQALVDFVLKQMMP